MGKTKPKSFVISKESVWLAYQRVKANRGACGIDQVSLKEFEENLQDNLYKIWNRMSSGCYFPPPVRRVDIPKANGETRPLGIPTVGELTANSVDSKLLMTVHQIPTLDANAWPFWCSCAARHIEPAGLLLKLR